MKKTEELRGGSAELEGKTEQEAKLGGMASRANLAERAKEDVADWAEYYRSTEVGYAKYKSESSSRMPYEIFEKWEDDAAYNFARMKESEAEAGFTSRYERDSVERIGSLDANKSIEADAGEYYMRRLRALNNAIQAANGPDKDADLAVGDQMYQRVGEHIYYEYDYETQRSDYKAYQNRRQDAHNKMIKHLNRMNDLARKYEVRPFTFRNFETNDFDYKESLDQYRDTDARADYDRTSVEAYCRNAFSSMYDKAERDNRRF